MNIGQLFLELLADGGRLKASVESEAAKAGDAGAAALSKRLSKGLAGVGKSLTTTGKSWTQNITLPVVGAGIAIAKVGAEFDTTMRQIVALTDTTAGEIDGVRTNILRLATEVGKTPDELAQGFYFLASAGFDTAEALTVLNSTAKASAAGLGTTADISRIVGAAINAFGKDNLTAGDAVDQLLRAIKDGTAEAPEFANALGNVLGSAGALGSTFADTSAAIAAMTLKGIGADEAATSLNAIFVSLLKTTPQAEGALKEVGLSSEGLRKQIREKGLLSTLQTLSGAFEGNDTAASAAFGNVRALRGILALTTGDAAQTASVFDDVADGTANLGDAFEATDGPGREFDKTVAEMQVLLIELSTDVLPVVVDILRTARGIISDVVGAFKGLPEPVRAGIVKFAALAAAIGPLLLVSGKVVSGLGQIVGALGKLAGSRVVGAAASAVGKLWSGVASSSIVKGAVAAAGNVASTAYLKALIAGDKVASAISSAFAKLPGSSKLASAVKAAGAKFGGLFSAALTAAIVAAPIVIAWQFAEEGKKTTTAFMAERQAEVDAILAKNATAKELASVIAQLEKEAAVLKNLANSGFPDPFGLDAGNKADYQATVAQIDALKAKLADLGSSGKTVTRDIGDGIIAGTGEVERAGDDMMAKLRAAVPGTVAKEAGEQIPQDIASGISERQSFVQSAMNNLRDLMENVLGRKKRIGLVIGDLISADLQKALHDRRWRVRNAAEQTEAGLIAELEKAISKGGKVGEDAMEALRKALRSKDPQIRAAAQHVKDIIDGKLDRVVTSAGNAGQDAGEAFAARLRRAIATGDFTVNASVGFSLPGRAEGGPVVAGMPYKINEQTPRSEVMVPSTSGYVLTHADAVRAVQAADGGGGGDTYHIPVTVQGALPVRTPRDVVTELRRIGELGLLPAATLSPKYRRREARG